MKTMKRRHSDSDKSSYDLLYDLQDILISSLNPKYEEVTISNSKDIVCSILNYIHQLNILQKEFPVGKSDPIWNQIRINWLKTHEYIPLVLDYYHQNVTDMAVNDISVRQFFDMSINFIAPVNVVLRGLYLNKMKNIIEELILFYELSTKNETISDSENYIIDIIIKYQESLDRILFFYRHVHNYLIENKVKRIDDPEEENKLPMERKQRLIDMKIYFR